MQNNRQTVRCLAAFYHTKRGIRARIKGNYRHPGVRVGSKVRQVDW
ncbi:hypothetical protein B2J93_3940 [Marssonina coronariae]|uniref:Uncharacterized protein n=1 Tax=Diplocarpon coronariae TaxID=2795749 RepID=A0A218YYC1_9HELO|nr:hypothetical protein B2J93_3940 [Marssonina coronariae]